MEIDDVSYINLSDSIIAHGAGWCRMVSTQSARFVWFATVRAKYGMLTALLISKSTIPWSCSYVIFR